MRSNLSDTGQGISVGGAMTSVMGALAQVEWMTIIGVVVAIGGFLMNWYYSRQRNEREKSEERRAQERHELEMQQLRREGNHES